MTKPLRAGVLYFAIAFGAGFVLGTLRVLLVAPAIGPVWATALELPLMLAISWVACGALARRSAVRGAGAGLLMGAFAFALLMAAEAALSVFVFGRTWAEHIAAHTTPEGLLGLAGQAVFGVFPAVRAGGR